LVFFPQIELGLKLIFCLQGGEREFLLFFGAFGVEKERYKYRARDDKRAIFFLLILPSCRQYLLLLLGLVV